MKQKINNIIEKCIVSFVLISSVFSPIISICSWNKSVSNEKQIVELASQIASMQVSIIDRLDIIDAHLSFLDKWAEKDQYFFYGDFDYNSRDTDNSTKFNNNNQIKNKK